ncbi:MAG: hypothetical protein ABEJ42_00440 [Halobacteriaceae archaeon]
MAGFWDTDAILFVIVIGTIPIHAFILMFFLNRRAFRRKKRGIHDWLAEKGLVEERKKRGVRERGE